MFLLQKFREFKENRRERSKRKITERELLHLNHKIDKLLVRLEEYEPEAATSPEDECVICISAKATMQTFPCGHRVVCRRCFVKTIQMAVSQRLLPLKCVICRAKILKLKQTSHGGVSTSSRGSFDARLSSSSSSSSSSLYQNRFSVNYTLRSRNTSSSLSSTSSNSSCDSVFSLSSGTSSSPSTHEASNAKNNSSDSRNYRRTSIMNNSSGLTSLFRNTDCFQSRSFNSTRRNVHTLDDSQRRARGYCACGVCDEDDDSGVNTNEDYDKTNDSYDKRYNDVEYNKSDATKTNIRATWRVSSAAYNNRMKNPMNKSTTMCHNMRENDTSNKRAVKSTSTDALSAITYSNHANYSTRQDADQVASLNSSTCNTNAKSSKSVDIADKSSNGNCKMSFFASLSSSFSPCSSSKKKYASSSSSSSCWSSVAHNQSTRGDSSLNSGKSSVAKNVCSRKKCNNESLYHRRYSSHNESLREQRVVSSATSAYNSSAFGYTGRASVRNVYFSSDKVKVANGKSSFANASYSEYRCHRSTKLHQLDSSSFYSNCYFYGNKLSNESSSLISKDTSFDFDETNRNTLNVMQIKSNSKSPTRSESLLPLHLPKIEERDDENDASAGDIIDSSQFNGQFTGPHGNSVLDAQSKSLEERKNCPTERESSHEDDQYDCSHDTNVSTVFRENVHHEKKVKLDETDAITDSENECTNVDEEIVIETSEKSMPNESSDNCKQQEEEEEESVQVGEHAVIMEDKREERTEEDDAASEKQCLVSPSLSPVTSRSACPPRNTNCSVTVNNNSTTDDDDHSLIANYTNQNRNNRSKFEFRFIINLLIAHLTNATGASASTISGDVQLPPAVKCISEEETAAVTLCSDHHHSTAKMNRYLKCISSSSSSHDADKNNHLSYRLTFHLRPMVSLFRRNK